MGQCFSDVKGGQQAVGARAQTAGGGGVNAAASSGLNDAVEHFFRARGEHALCTQIEVQEIGENFFLQLLHVWNNIYMT